MLASYPCGIKYVRSVFLYVLTYERNQIKLGPVTVEGRRREFMTPSERSHAGEEQGGCVSDAQQEGCVSDTGCVSDAV